MPVAEARAVVLVIDPETRAILWQDSETFGLREYRTAEKVVGRFRQKLAESGRGAGIGSEAATGRDAGIVCDAGTVPAGSLPERPQSSGVVTRGAEWTSRRGTKVGYRWQAVVANADDSDLPIRVHARLIDSEGNVLITEARSTVVPAGGKTTVVGDGDVPERTALLATDWEIVAQTASARPPREPVPGSPPTPPPPRPMPTDAHDFDFGHDELRSPGLDAETVSKLVLPPGTAARVSCLVREDGTVVTAVVRSVEPRTLTTGQVGDITQLLVSQAVTDWRFEPGRKSGEPVAGWITVELSWD